MLGDWPGAQEALARFGESLLQEVEKPEIGFGTQSLAAQPQQIAPGNAQAGQTTAPQPASWQQWGGGMAYQNPAAVNPTITGGTTALVPGAIPSVAQLPTMGTATYHGSFSVTQNPGSPVAGSVAIGWNFGNQTGNFLAVANGQNGNTGSATAPLRLNPARRLSAAPSPFPMSKAVEA